MRRTGLTPGAAPGRSGAPRLPVLRFLICQAERPAEPAGLVLGSGWGRGVTTSAGNKGYCSAPLELLKEVPVFRERGREQFI